MSTDIAHSKFRHDQLVYAMNMFISIVQTSNLTCFFSPDHDYNTTRRMTKPVQEARTLVDVNADTKTSNAVELDYETPPSYRYKTHVGMVQNLQLFYY